MTAASLPVEPAGTPTLDEATLVKLIRETIDASFVVGLNRGARRNDAESEEQGTTATTLGRQLFASARALTSEVSALREAVDAVMREGGLLANCASSLSDPDATLDLATRMHLTERMLAWDDATAALRAARRDGAP